MSSTVIYIHPLKHLQQKHILLDPKCGTAGPVAAVVSSASAQPIQRGVHLVLLAAVSEGSPPITLHVMRRFMERSLFLLIKLVA